MDTMSPPNSRYGQSKTNAYRRIWRPESSINHAPSWAYDCSSLPASPTTLTPLDETKIKFRHNKIPTNSVEFLHPGKGRRLRQLNNSDLPFNSENETSKLSNTGLKTKYHSKTKNMNENLIQLEDSPKHSLIARKTLNSKCASATSNSGINNIIRFEDELGQSTSGFSQTQGFSSNLDFLFK